MEERPPEGIAGRDVTARVDGKRMTVLLMPIKAAVKPRANPAAKQAREAKPAA
jgi:hypothetical protein